MLQCVSEFCVGIVCCSMLQCATVCYSVLQYVTVCYSVLHIAPEDPVREASLEEAGSKEARSKTLCVALGALLTANVYMGTFMCVNIYIYIYTHTHIYIYIYINIYIYIYIYIYT